MARINATVRDEHMEQLKEVKKTAEGEISDAEATRRIFDRAASVQAIEQDLRDCEQRVSELRADRDEAVAQARQEVRNELEAELDDLERENERLQREKRQILEQREENTELVKAVKEERTLAKRKAEAGLWTKTKWALFGMKDKE
jgi:chromosome segregation ATPase